MDNRLKRSRAQEKKTASLHQGTVNAGSGNGWVRKSDVRTRYTLIETKRTDAKQITLTDKALRTNHDLSWAEGRIPVLGFELQGKRYIVLEEDDYLGPLEGVDGAPRGTTTLDGGCEVSGGQPRVVFPRSRGRQPGRGRAGQEGVLGD